VLHYLGPGLVNVGDAFGFLLQLLRNVTAGDEHGLEIDPVVLPNQPLLDKFR
jgi:hypothetical protein